MRNALSGHLLDAATAVLLVTATIVGGKRFLSTRSEGRIVSVSAKAVASPAQYYAGLAIGPTEGKVQIVVFSDFYCPFCRRLAADLDRVMEDHPREVKVWFRHFPTHEFSRDAAYAAICAASAGVFRSFHDRLMRELKTNANVHWGTYATQVGVRDPVEFSRCLTSEATNRAFRNDSLAAAALGVTGTPAVLLGHALYRGSPGRQRLTELVDSLVRIR